MAENKVGVEFYIAGASNVARDVQKISGSLNSVAKIGANLAGMGYTMKAVGRLFRAGVTEIAESSSTVTRQLDALKASWDSSRTHLAKALAPILADDLSLLNSLLGTNAKKWTDWADAAIHAMIRVQDRIAGDRADQWIQHEAMARYQQEAATADSGSLMTAFDIAAQPYDPAMDRGRAEIDWGRVREIEAQLRRENADLLSGSMSSAGGAGVTEAQRTARKQIEEMNAALDRQIYIQTELSAGRTHAADVMQYSIVLEQAYGDKIDEQIRLYAEYEQRLKVVDQIKRDLAAGQYIQGMEQEVEYLRLVVEGRTQEAEALRIVNDLKKQGIELTPVEKQQVEALVAEQASLTKEIDKQQDSARRWGRVMQQSIDGVADALAGVFVYSEDIGENFKNLALSLAFDWTRQSISSGIGALLHVPTKHNGGVVGRDSGPSRWVDPMVFAGAPRLHSGLRSDEFPAILQQGEEVLSRNDVRAGRSSPNVSVNVINNGTAKNARTTEPEWNGREYVIGVILDDYDKGGKTRALIRGRR